jgi:hypothetical protein
VQRDNSATSGMAARARLRLIERPGSATPGHWSKSSFTAVRFRSLTRGDSCPACLDFPGAALAHCQDLSCLLRSFPDRKDLICLNLSETLPYTARPKQFDPVYYRTLAQSEMHSLIT